VYGLRIPDEILLDSQLPPDGKIVYGLLAASGPNFNPSLTQISRSLGMSRKRIIPAIRTLEARGVITVARPSRRFYIEGSRRFIENTRYTVRVDAKRSVWVRPGRVRSLVEATPGRSRVLALLLHVYERQAVRVGQPRPSISKSASDLYISTASVERARAILASF
jgi:biotin operon repressor